MLERGVSKYADMFVFKGGFVVSTLLGLDTRMTRDLDATFRDTIYNVQDMENIIQEVVNTESKSFFEYSLRELKVAQVDDHCSGFIAAIEAICGTTRIKLKIENLDKKFGDYSQCENLWINDETISIESLKLIFARLRSVLQNKYPDKYYPYYEDEVFSSNLILGRAVEDMHWVYRIKTEYKKCPLCGSSIFPHEAALSRRDNEIEICSQCGFLESVEDMADFRDL